MIIFTVSVGFDPLFFHARGQIAHDLLSPLAPPLKPRVVIITVDNRPQRRIPKAVQFCSL